MFNIFVERLEQASELISAASVLLRQYVDNADVASLKPTFANTIYNIQMQLHHTLCGGVLGDENCNIAMDELFDNEPMRTMTAKLIRKLRIDFVTVIMETFHVIKGESQLLSTGRINLADLSVLNIAAIYRIESDINPDTPNMATFSSHFHCARQLALIATEEQRTTPIECMSLHATMNGLHAIYRSTATAPYSPEFEKYTRILLLRAFDFLMIPGDKKMWNMRDYRTQTTTPGIFRYSTLLLRDITIIWHSLCDYFDLAYLLPLELNPRSYCQPDAEAIRLARNWLRRHCSKETETWVRDQLVLLSMYAGEFDLFHADHRGQHSTPELILRENRVIDYYRLTECAPVPPSIIVNQMLLSDAEFEKNGHNAQRESLHMSLIVLSTFKSRIKAAQPSLDPSAFVVLYTELRNWSIYIRQCTTKPILLLMYNHVQLWFGGQVLMYNNALESLAAWMLIVEKKCGGRLDNYPVGDFLDDYFRPTESATSRLKRLATTNGIDLPDLGTGGVW